VQHSPQNENRMIIDRNSPIPQYFQLQTWLIGQIEQGIFKPHDKIPTEEEITQETGMARATIRQAIQNLVNMGYLYRKRRLGTFVLSQTAGSGKNRIVGVLVHDIRSGYAPELLRGIGDEAARCNYSVILCNTDDLFSRADFHANQLIQQDITGLIFMPAAAPPEKNRQLIEKFHQQNIPVVLFDREIPDYSHDIVITDNYQGAYDLTSYLIAMGHRNIAITLSTSFSSERARLAGYKQALADHTLSVNPALLFTIEERFIEKQYQQYARIILAERKKFTALFAGNDPIAYILYKAAAEMGVAIPSELSLVGYDDLAFSSAHPMDLTTVHQPIYEMGCESMRLLVQRIDGLTGPPQTIVLGSHLVERRSVQRIESAV
jgi:DNA-binding LacI/PurR family transcriptional regulator